MLAKADFIYIYKWQANFQMIMSDQMWHFRARVGPHHISIPVTEIISYSKNGLRLTLLYYSNKSGGKHSPRFFKNIS